MLVLGSSVVLELGSNEVLVLGSSVVPELGSNEVLEPGSKLVRVHNNGFVDNKRQRQ